MINYFSNRFFPFLKILFYFFEAVNGAQQIQASQAASAVSAATATEIAKALQVFHFNSIVNATAMINWIGSRHLHENLTLDKFN